MKKRMIAILIMAALCTGCGQKENSAESYNEKPDKDEVAVNAAEMWDVETSYGSIQDLMSEAECVVYAEVKKLEYTVEDGSVSTDETVQVIDNLYGDVNKGEEINIFKMGGYAKIKDYIDSYEEEYREQARNFAGFNNLTEKDIETKYVSFLPQGEVDTDVGDKAVYFLKKREDESELYERIGAYEGEYVELSNGEFKVPGLEEYEEVNSAAEDNDESMETCITSWDEIVGQIQ